MQSRHGHERVKSAAQGGSDSCGIVNAAIQNEASDMFGVSTPSGREPLVIRSNVEVGNESEGSGLPKTHLGV